MDTGGNYSSVKGFSPKSSNRRPGKTILIEEQKEELEVDVLGDGGVSGMLLGKSGMMGDGGFGASTSQMKSLMKSLSNGNF